MAYEASLTTISAPAAADLSAKQYYAVTLNGSANAALCTTAKNMTGILQNTPGSGQAASIGTNGFSKAVLGTGGTTAGNLLEVESGGTFVDKASGIAVARAVSTGLAGDIITVEILKSNSAFA